MYIFAHEGAEHTDHEVRAVVTSSDAVNYGLILAIIGFVAISIIVVVLIGSFIRRKKSPQNL